MAVDDRRIGQEVLCPFHRILGQESILSLDPDKDARSDKGENDEDRTGGSFSLLTGERRRVCR